MVVAVEQTLRLLEQMVQGLPIGTNQALLYLFWALLCGAFLQSRGAIFPALQSLGLTAAQIRRCGQALRQGAWTINDLLRPFRAFALAQGQWQPNRYEGFRPLAGDVTTFWRPRLKGWAGKFFHSRAGKALKGIGFGLLVEVGTVGERRIPLLRCILRAEERDNQKSLTRRLLHTAARDLKPDEVLISDAGVSIAEVQEAGIARYVLRGRENCTARRNELPARKKRGHPPEYGPLVRPLLRRYRGRTIPATPPDEQQEFRHQGRVIQAQGWHGLVRSDQKVSAQNPTFSIWVFRDPRYRTPLVLITNLSVSAEAVFRLYLDRWPVEQIPQVAKPLLGLERQWVFAQESIQRLPEMALLAANGLLYLAAVLPPVPTGFWDGQPRQSPGRLRRVLEQAGFPKDYPLNGRIREKRSVTAHLPKGVKAHRRQKAAPKALPATS